MSAANGCGMSTNNTIHEALCECGGGRCGNSQQRGELFCI